MCGFCDEGQEGSAVWESSFCDTNQGRLKRICRNIQGLLRPHHETGTLSFLPPLAKPSHDEGVGNISCLLLQWKAPQNHMTRDRVNSEELDQECGVPQKAPCACFVCGLYYKQRRKAG